MPRSNPRFVKYFLSSRPRVDGGRRFAVAITASFLLVGMAAAGDNRNDIDLAIENGARQGGDAVAEVSEGSEVVIHVTSDRDAELHLHGYDIEVSVIPDEPAEISFQAELSGRFPLTLHSYDGEHGSDKPLLYVDVYPN